MAGSYHLPPPTFDLDTWAGNYEGTLLPLRLAHVAMHCPSLVRPSLTLALSAAKSGKDTQIYNKLTELARNLGQPELSAAVSDAEWTTKQDEANRRELSRLEGELRGYKNNLIRESIRMGQEDLATHLLLTGGPALDPAVGQSPNSVGYNAAYLAFSRMRDYCTTPTHVASMTLRLAYTALVAAVSALQSGSPANTHFHSVLANASRLASAGVKEEEQAKLTPIAHVCNGIAQLGLGHYRDAAAILLTTPFEYHTLGPVHGADFRRTVASANDVAIYGGLTALATLSREELLDRVLGGNFRQFLELEPHMRKAISLYTTAKYQACLATLRHYYSDWSLDVFLGAPAAQHSASSSTNSHLDSLLAIIRQKSITAYFSSFSSVSLSALAHTFPPPSSSSNPSSASSLATMEAEVLTLISSGQLHARLDVVNGTLTAPRATPRATAHANARSTAEEVEAALWLRLHRVNVAMAGLEVPQSKGPKGGPGMTTLSWEGGNAGY